MRAAFAIYTKPVATGKVSDIYTLGAFRGISNGKGH